MSVSPILTTPRQSRATRSTAGLKLADITPLLQTRPGRTPSLPTPPPSVGA